MVVSARDFPVRVEGKNPKSVWWKDELKLQL